jgi:hypothetical protein
MQFTKYFVNECKHTDPLPYEYKHELLFLTLKNLWDKIRDRVVTHVAINYLFTIDYLSINHIKYTWYFGHVTQRNRLLYGLMLMSVSYYYIKTATIYIKINGKVLKKRNMRK